MVRICKNVKTTKSWLETIIHRITWSQNIYLLRNWSFLQQFDISFFWRKVFIILWIKCHCEIKKLYQFYYHYYIMFFIKWNIPLLLLNIKLCIVKLQPMLLILLIMLQRWLNGKKDFIFKQKIRYPISTLVKNNLL